MRLGYLENEEANRELRAGDRSAVHGLVGLPDSRLGPGSAERQDQAQGSQIEDAAVPFCTRGQADLVGDTDSDGCLFGGLRPEGSASESSIRLANLLVFVSSARPAVGDL